MPIINTVIQGGGTTPTGTKSITANGVYDVTDYASADVQVPTTAPTYYIEKIKGSIDGLLKNSTNIINLNGTTGLGKFVLSGQYAWVTFPSNTSIDLSSITTVDANSMYYCFYSSLGITSVDLSSLTTIGGSYAVGYCFNSCTSLTSVDLSSLTTISGDHGITYCFYNCPGLTSIDLSSLTTIGGSYAMAYCFYGCSGLTSIDLSSLTTIDGSYAMNYCFDSCTSLTSIDLSSLITIDGSYAMNHCFNSCTSLTSVDLSSLITIGGDHSMANYFSGCTGLTSVSFPSMNINSFNSSSIKALYRMLGNVTGCTVHFPNNMQSKVSTLDTYPSFYGTNTTVLFDLPATVTLTGADTIEYTRNPKYDTATALAWKVGAYGTANLTPAYYTSGTTDPQVGDTIYSDSACTTAETTISSIA